MHRELRRVSDQQRSNGKGSFPTLFPGRLPHKDPLADVDVCKFLSCEADGITVAGEIYFNRIPERNAHNSCKFSTDDNVLFGQWEDLLVCCEMPDRLIILHYSEQTGTCFSRSVE